MIDISMPLEDGVVAWPGSIGYSRRLVSSLESGDPVNASVIEMDVHTGTHVDAPLHFIAGGGATEGLLFEDLVGPALVADVRGTSVIQEAHLRAAGVTRGVRRVLLKTDNHRARSTAGGFDPEYAALDASSSSYLVSIGVRLVGIDYLSIQRFSDGPEVHNQLLSGGVVILEGIILDHVQPGSYRLICLPILLSGSEGAPARAVLEPLADREEES